MLIVKGGCVGSKPKMDQGPAENRQHDGRSLKNRKARRAAQAKIAEEKEQLKQKRIQLEEQENHLNQVLRTTGQAHDEMVEATLTGKRHVKNERDETATWMKKNQEARLEARKAEVKYQGLVGDLEGTRNEAIQARQEKEMMKQKLKEAQEAVCAIPFFRDTFIDPCACQESNMWKDMYLNPDLPAATARQWLLISKGTVAISFPFVLTVLWLILCWLFFCRKASEKRQAVNLFALLKMSLW